MYGSQQSVPLTSFIPVNLASFSFQPNDTAAYPVPSGWSGRLSMLVMLKNGPNGSRVYSYFRQAESNVQLVPYPATAG